MSAAAITNVAIAVNAAINLLAKAAEYQALAAKAQAEGRDITDDELRAALAKLGDTIEQGRVINAALPDA